MSTGGWATPLDVRVVANYMSLWSRRVYFTGSFAQFLVYSSLVVVLSGLFVFPLPCGCAFRCCGVGLG